MYRKRTVCTEEMGTTQYQEWVIILLGQLGDALIGSSIITGNLSGKIYLDMLKISIELLSVHELQYQRTTHKRYTLLIYARYAAC